MENHYMLKLNIQTFHVVKGYKAREDMDPAKTTQGVNSKWQSLKPLSTLVRNEPKFWFMPSSAPFISISIYWEPTF